MPLDPMEIGLANGFAVWRGSEETHPIVEVDVCIIGSGAGGAMMAEHLTSQGFEVGIVEEGPLRTTQEFHMKESESYPDLYQECAARKTKDKAISILQGRAVGGSTVVNWTTCFRTPDEVLAWWRQNLPQANALADLTSDAMAPWFQKAEERLGITRWTGTPNPNNSTLQKGCENLGISHGVIHRNVRGCYNSGYCGMGCPTGAKQSMLVTALPSALSKGARLWHRLRAERFVWEGTVAKSLVCTPLSDDDSKPHLMGDGTVKSFEIRARHYVVAGGAINTPALLLRSQAPDPERVLGKRTFLHPVVVSGALFKDPIHAHAGAPQSIYSDHFLKTQPLAGPIGFKLEVPPLHPILTATTLVGYGKNHRHLMERFAHLQALIALARDGFHPEAPGGTLSLRSDGTPVLDYPISTPLWDAFRRGLLAMAEIQFAAGAEAVLPIHEDAPATGYKTWAEAKEGIQRLPLERHRLKIVSAHVMGGCPMGLWTDSFGGSLHVDNLTVADGSLFPTSLGVNPQLSVYGFALRAAAHLVEKLKT